MKVSDFHYELPDELIAQRPAERRDAARMLVMDRSSGACRIRSFRDFPSLLREEDCLVVNNTRVIPARLFGHRQESGGRVEAFLLENLGDGLWKSMLKPGRRLRPGARVDIEGGNGACYEVIRKQADGSAEIRFSCDDVKSLLERVGAVPLPPYIRRVADSSDTERYQTVYAVQPGAVAAPTAGLHFTPEILTVIREKGTRIAAVTLHVGAGTFKPVSTEHVEDHVMHEESYELTDETASVINTTKTRGGRVIAVGTTSVRVLESCLSPDGNEVVPGTGRTRLFMYPPAKPRITDALLTNFHLPGSTLLMLVSCFSSREHVLNAYALAVRERMRFYSYGDCMFLTDDGQDIQPD